MLKKVLWSLLAIVVLAAAGLAVFVLTYRPAQRPASAERIELTPERVARGEYLVSNVLGCGDCHSDREWSLYGGPVRSAVLAGAGCMGPEQGAPGRICFPNLTPDPETGLGAWSDGEVLRAIREGVGRDGRALFPMMPYSEYRKLSDEDASAVVAYLRSVPPVENPVPRTEIDFPVSFFIEMAPRPLDGPVAAPARAESAAYGEYLAQVAGCAFCHTPVHERMQALPGRAFAGGHVHQGPWGTVAAPNLTPHPTGLGGRSKENFLGMFRAFAGAESRAIPASAGQNTPMPWLSHSGMSDEDLGAIWEYLQTVPPVENPVGRRPPPDADRQPVAESGGEADAVGG